MTNWTEPTKRNGKCWKIAVVPPNAEWNVISLASAYVGLDVHWEPARGRRRGRAIYCPGVDVCDRCGVGYLYEWRGYLPIAPLSGGERYLLQLTTNAVNEITESLHGHSTGLLGVQIELKRGPRRNSTLHAVCQPIEPRPEGDWMSIVTLRSMVERIYGIKQKSIVKVTV